MIIFVLLFEKAELYGRWGQLYLPRTTQEVVWGFFKLDFVVCLHRAWTVLPKTTFLFLDH